ncbi:hypothetical protein [Streptomyces anulatus]|uniref:hypothetical protein n=1 Tax=Streptomyces anulatus TaxID=1892 RepID=UPI0034133B3B
MSPPTPGRTVLYRLSDHDATVINQRRTDYAASAKATRTGFVAHVGNEAVEGAVYPAVVVRTWADHPAVNLVVFLDGADTFWATSRLEGDDVGQWAWPEVK